MQYESFALVLASVYDTELICIRCQKYKDGRFQEMLCASCKKALAIHNCQICYGLFFENQKCDICETHREEDAEEYKPKNVENFDDYTDEEEDSNQTILDYPENDEEEDEWGLFDVDLENEDEEDEYDDEDDI